VTPNASIEIGEAIPQGKDNQINGNVGAYLHPRAPTRVLNKIHTFFQVPLEGQ
jgi:hypothetical protein